MQARAKPTSILDRYRRVRIIGQGLTGSLLALHLKEAGIPFIVQDTDLPGCATAVAPGIVNPLSGRNFRPPEFIHELLEQVKLSMDLVERSLGLTIWSQCPILRMFAEPPQLDRFHKSLTDFGSAEFVSEQFGENTFPHLNDVFGSFLTIRGGWANLPLLMQRSRDWLRKQDLLVEEAWVPPDAPPGDDSKEEELVIFCEGWHVANNPWWSFIPHNPAKGEMLLVRFEEEIPRDRIYNQSCWMQPIEDDLWRVGATYSWSSFDSNASLEGANRLQENLQLLTSCTFHVVDQMAGVRPIVDDYQPVIGRHPEVSNWYILNAMGSKGVLQAPTAVRDLLDHLQTGTRIPTNWDVARFE